MNIYTIIVTYNAMQKQWIDRCLKSLENSTIRTTVIKNTPQQSGYHKKRTWASAKPTMSV